MSCQISSVAETKRRGKDALPRKRDHILNSGTLLPYFSGWGPTLKKAAATSLKDQFNIWLVFSFHFKIQTMSLLSTIA